jgi:peptide/nickel transport system ATP-binding protein
MNAPPLLDIVDVSLSYRTRRRVVHALQTVNLSVAEGEAVGLVGESGSGKSTVARAVLGLTPAHVAHRVGKHPSLGP